MNIYNAIHLFFGFCRFETDIKGFVRLSNRLSEKRLHFWSTEIKENRVLFSASVFGAEEISDLAHELSVPLKTVMKKGLPFVFSRYRKRYGMLLGIGVAMFLLLYSQLFVWKITVSGNSKVSEVEIVNALSKCGIEPGSWVSKINVERDANLLLMNCRGLSSAAINIKGTHIEVIVLERTSPPEIDNPEGYYNVVATHDGIILDIDAVDGTPEVKEGDTVFAGELLINSFVAGNYGSFRPTHARGIVYAAVRESFTVNIPLQRPGKHFSGNTERVRIIKLFGYELPSLFSKETPYEYFDSMVAQRDFKLFGFIELPIRVQTIIYSEYTPEIQTITEQTAELLASQELDSMLAELDCEVLSLESEFTGEKNGICTLNAKAVLKLNIAKEVEFNIESNQTIFDRFPIARE